MPSIRSVLRLAVLSSTHVVRILGQQFEYTPFYLDYPGLTATCAAALNTVVECPSLLKTAAEYQPLFEESQLIALCATSCKASLETVKQYISGNCTTDTDTIVKDGTTYPATYVVDQFLHAFDKACMRDPETGKFCDIILSSWLAHNAWKKEYKCHDCIFGLMKKELESPLGWSPSLASEFNATAASCQLERPQHVLQPPNRYVLNTSAKISTNQQKLLGSPPRNCTRPYTLQEGDTCKSIALAQNVSSAGVMVENRLDAYCSDIAARSETICLPERCATHVVKSNQTCWDVISQYGGISVMHLKKWNPRLNTACSNMQDLAGDVICISAPGKPLPVKAIIQEKYLKRQDGFDERPGQIRRYPEVSGADLDAIRWNVWNKGYETVTSDSVVYLKPTAAASFSVDAATASVAVWG